jgi:periplasmic divalent cation tolerance protein
MSEIDSLYLTYPTLESARAQAEKLLAQRLIACANILPTVESRYLWQGEAQVQNEVVVLAKAPRAHRETIKQAVTASHPYQTPCILFTEVADANDEYQAWVRQQTDP